ncbi:MAG: hypothetical protein JO254_05770 [Pseudolabrys sp.]|nr:hypothetical protein [Pseudolabrys sp.]
MTTSISNPARSLRPTLIVAVTFGALVAGTGSLWAYYGTAVFFEMVRNGWAACF